MMCVDGEHASTRGMYDQHGMIVDPYPSAGLLR